HPGLGIAILAPGGPPDKLRYGAAASGAAAPEPAAHPGRRKEGLMKRSGVDRQTHPFGQFFMVGIPGPGVDAVAREMVQDLRVGGIILFSRNLETPQQIWHLTHDLQRLAREA